jgi:signal transduction histidine kinase/ligand-binding sensor domain-containing protein
MQRTPDGYLWMNAYNGLMRFDGVRFTLVDSTTVPEFRGVQGFYSPRFVDTSGTLWVQGPRPGWMFLSYRDGRFRVRIPGGSGIRLLEQDGSGRLWAVTTRLHLLTDGVLGPAPIPPEVPDTDITSIRRDTGSGMWIGTNRNGLWHVAGGRATHYASGRVQPYGQTSDGTFWAAVEDMSRGVSRLVDGKWHEVRGPDNERIVLRDVVEGPDGSIWLPTNTLGVLRWRNGAVERFSRLDGLSSSLITGLFVAKEGAVWVATTVGLDRLRPSTFVTIDSRDGFADNARSAFVPDVGGAMWILTQSDSVVQLDNGPIRRQSGRITSKAFAGPSTGAHHLIAASRAGGVWVSASQGGLVHYTALGPKVVDERAGLPAERIDVGIETRDGTLWVLAFGGEFGRLRDGRYREIKLSHGRVSEFIEDGLGRVWAASRSRNSLLAFVGDSVVAELPLPLSGAMDFRSLTLEGGDTVWVANAQSLFRITGGRATEVHAPAVTRLFGLGAMLKVTGGQLWIAGPAGVARVPVSSLHRVADGESLTIEPKIFGELDGIPGGRISPSNLHPMQVGPDGRLWVVTNTGLAVADPSVEYTNRVAPAVHIEEVSVGGAVRAPSDGAMIPANPTRVAIRYVAPMLGLPERGRVQYRLDGADDTWIEGKPPHVAEYNQLRPRRYRFRVRAWNEDGVPSAREATLSFRVLPAWYQAWWFFALGIVAIASVSGGGVAAVQRRRSQRVTRDAQARFDAVLSERTRLARELHDTLLQGFTGITLKLDSVRDSLAARAEPAADTLSDILLLADRTLREAREMVWDIRQPGSTIEDLGEALRAASEDLTRAGGVELRHSVDGVPRQLPPVVVATILRIAKEAVVNAMKHGRPSSVAVRLIYEPRAVLLEIDDDGIGADPAAFAVATARGHWGVAGMHERARAAGGTVVVTSAPGQGTHVNVTLPAEPTEPIS